LNDSSIRSKFNHARSTGALSEQGIRHGTSDD
jgi:hypothetical protein